MLHSSKRVQLDTLKANYAHKNVHVKGFCSRMGSFGERLREERERIGLNQDKFGELGGVNRNSQANYEKGTRKPDAAYLAAVAAEGVDVLYVLTGQRTPGKEEGLSVREQTVLQNYRALSEDDQAAMQRLSTALAQSTPAAGVKEK